MSVKQIYRVTDVSKWHAWNHFEDSKNDTFSKIWYFHLLNKDGFHIHILNIFICQYSARLSLSFEILIVYSLHL